MTSTLRERGEGHLSAEPLTDHIPIMRRDSDGVIITQFDYPTCETLGLLKMDFLGLRNLTSMRDRLKAITPIHVEFEESLEEILGTTYGLIVYQERGRLASVR